MGWRHQGYGGHRKEHWTGRLKSALGSATSLLCLLARKEQQMNSKIPAGEGKNWVL